MVEEPGTVEVPAVVDVSAPGTVEDGVELEDDALVDELAGVELDDVPPAGVGVEVEEALPGIEGPAEVDEPGVVEARVEDDELLDGADDDDELEEAGVVDDVWADTAPLLSIAAQPTATTKNAPLVRVNRAVGLFDICT